MTKRRPCLSFLEDLRSNPPDEVVLAVVEHIKANYPEAPDVAAELARILAESGERVDADGHLVADVASTGGPSSLSTLISPLYLRAAGAVVPKLGVPGRPAGGIDSMAQIEGYRTALTRVQVDSVLESGGFAHFLAQDELAPLDGRIFRLRQSIGAQAVPSLVAGSILAKKLAVGVKWVGLDIRVAPYGNFGADWASALKNGQLFFEAASILGIKASPVLTDANFPYQPYLGRGEALVALFHLFEATADSWLERHHAVCRSLALMSVPEEYRGQLARVDRSMLRHYFYDNLRNQGSAPVHFEAAVQSVIKDHRIRLIAERAGFVSFPLRELRELLVKWQNFFSTTNNPFADPVGLVLIREPGEWVEKGEPLATLRVTPSLLDEALETLQPLVCRPLKIAIGLGMEALNG